MTIQLIQGQFNANEAIDIITKMIHVKIKYHENKIAGNSNEEDIKNRETKIKHLQKELFEARKGILLKKENVGIDATINII
ncbi:hypothetical protein QWZ08_06930 [Ferruginibacter paludis]|uniref:hypothetical protein n=1 Tax=Ferruginibacter paludis TaxID=1310417 RepID=UPI0025B59177|nr:hypothetical protein [Ferruginibacter paludis]MDN3655350.1 hypothetical protein [Ferruginibacter paludis]